MRNPLRSEQAAFRLVWLTIGYFLVIVAAAKLGGRWVGLGVFLAETALIAAVIMVRRPRGRVDEQEPASHGS